MASRLLLAPDVALASMKETAGCSQPGTILAFDAALLAAVHACKAFCYKARQASDSKMEVKVLRTK